jgi:hypothetical protein
MRDICEILQLQCPAQSGEILKGGETIDKEGII